MTDFGDDLPAPAAKRRLDQPEHRLSAFCDDMLGRILLEPCWFTAQDTAARAIGETAEQRANSRMMWQQKQRKYGIKPSQLDWRIYQTPIYAEIELKTGSHQPTSGQVTTMRLLRERSIVTGCVWTLRGFYNILVDAGFRL